MAPEVAIETGKLPGQTVKTAHVASALAPGQPKDEQVVVVEIDPFYESLLKSLQKAGVASAGSLGEARKRIQQAVNASGPGVAPLKAIQCFGTDDPNLLERRNEKIVSQLETADDEKQGEIVRGLPRDGCVQDVRYLKVEDVVAVDRHTFRAPPTDQSLFYGWRGSNGHTAPRFANDGLGKKVIVTTWFFLMPETKSLYELSPYLKERNERMSHEDSQICNLPGRELALRNGRSR